MRKQAIVFGATGAIGSQLLKLCLEGDRYSNVIVVARKPATLANAKLTWIERGLSDLDEMPLISGLIGGDAYCCLGTTIKTAGSKEKFHQVDFDYVVYAARFAKSCGVNNFSMISAIGADSKSRSFYNRTKGEVEIAVINEDLPCVRIFRPSLLKGKRNEFRLLEWVGNLLSILLKPVFYFGLRKYQPIEISRVAKAMYEMTNSGATSDKVKVYESDVIQEY